MNVNQPTAKPTRKVTAGAAAGALAAVLMAVFAVFWPEYYQRVPPGAEASLAVLLSTVVAYFIRDPKS